MSLSLIGLGVFGVLFLMILAIVSNTSEESLEDLQNQMFLMNCPAPSYDGQYNSTNVTIEGFVVVLNTSSSFVDFGGEGTVFRCTITPLTPFPAFQVFMSNKNYQETTLGFPTGWFNFIGDFFGSLFQRISNFFILLGYFITPTNFNIMGYTLSDLGGVALMFVIGIYALSYIFISVMIYKIISPFSGVS